MNTEVSELGELIEKMLECGARTFKQQDVVQEFGCGANVTKIHYSLSLRITKAESPTGEVINYEY